MKKKPNPIIHSFPVQLIFTHFRRNIALLAIWLVLLSAMLGNIGHVYGIHYLFLDPEYLGTVNFWSFFLVGITFGQLTMAFHIASYILDSHRFTFLGALKRPFALFALNNSLIPFLIFTAYVVLVIRFQLNTELQTNWSALNNVLGLISGVIIILIISFTYFKFTNKDLFKDVAQDVDKRLRKSGLSRERMMKRLAESKRQQLKFTVHNYIDLSMGIKKTDQSEARYSKEEILRVFDQNHINSVLIGLSLIIALVLMGGFVDNPMLQIPAGASSMLALTIGVILLGSVSYWFRGWGLPFVLVLFFVVNFGVKKGLGSTVRVAKGLDYETTPAYYHLDTLRALNGPDEFNEDVHEVIHSLENWKRRQKVKKPKMMLIAVSGGGQRSALWTLNALQSLDTTLRGGVLGKATLISGASGGMIGAAYYRELYLRSLEDDSLHRNDPAHLQSIAKDNLNPVIFSLLVNDSFMSFREFEYAGKTYKKDRGYSFERNLNQNIGDVLNKKLSDYRVPEEEGLIPTMLLSPTIANDGRKLYVTSRPFSFMNTSGNGDNSQMRGVDFYRLFEKQDAQDLSFMSALRMSASFPYITPTISLPSKPQMEIMDAGIADNFGVSDALRFLYVFRNWIKENTSGVVLVQIRDNEPNERIHSRPIPSIVDRLTYPIASVYNNLANIQDRNNDVRLEQAKEWLGGNFETFSLIYDTSEDESEQERASLSWHLTTIEKESIIGSIQSKKNKKALNELRALFHSE